MLQSAQSRLLAAWIAIQNPSDRYHCADGGKFRPFGPTKIPREIDTTHVIAQVPRRDGQGAGGKRKKGKDRGEERGALPLSVPREIQRVRGTNPGCHANGRKADCGDGRTLATDSGQTPLGLPIGIRECHFGVENMYTKLQQSTKI